jgi:hypothetical protein
MKKYTFIGDIHGMDEWIPIVDKSLNENIPVIF